MGKIIDIDAYRKRIEPIPFKEPVWGTSIVELMHEYNKMLDDFYSNIELSNKILGKPRRRPPQIGGKND